MMTPRDYALLAQAAYSETPIIGREDSAARVIETQAEEGLIISVPGTNNPACLIADLDFFTVNTPYGSLHGGIYRAFIPTFDQCLGLDIHALTGHSEGAAGALLIGAYLCANGKAPKEIHAFEPPKLSTDSRLRDIFEFYQVNVKIYHHGHDLVPLMPIGANWQHCADVTQFGTPSSIVPNFEDHEISRIIADL